MYYVIYKAKKTIVNIFFRIYVRKIEHLFKFYSVYGPQEYQIRGLFFVLYPRSDCVKNQQQPCDFEDYVPDPLGICVVYTR